MGECIYADAGPVHTDLGISLFLFYFKSAHADAGCVRLGWSRLYGRRKFYFVFNFFVRTDAGCVRTDALTRPCGHTYALMFFLGGWKCKRGWI
jgi:hypothetical protein